MMDPASVLSIAHSCYYIGGKLVDMCLAWKHAHEEVEQRVVIVESCWSRTWHQVSFTHRLTPLMSDDLRRVLADLLSQLSHALSHAVSTIETVTRRDSLTRPSLLGFGQRAKKASWVWKKEALDETIADLERWQRRFDPSWFLLIKIADPVVDSELAKANVAEEGVGRPATAARNPLALAAGLRGALAPKAEEMRSLVLPEMQMQFLDIPFSDAKAARRLSSNDTRWYVVDTIEVDPTARVRDVSQDVLALAAKLSQADPIAFGLLNCKGVMGVTRRRPSSSPSRQRDARQSLGAPGRPAQHPSPSPSLAPPSRHPSRSPSPSLRDFSSFRFVFRIPEGMEVLQSLRQLLLNSDAHISLSRKLCIARELAKATSYVHALAFVHKNMRPESVLCFEDPESSRSNAFLVGFDAFRAAGAGTVMEGDMSWDRNVYRHPLRQGDDPAERYRMQHDIYSLGVCLLEIGLWESFVEYTDGSEVAGPPRSKFGQSYRRFQAWLKERPRKEGSRDAGGTTFLDSLAFRLKDYLVEQARTRLAPRMGDQYARVVVSCLTCLDDDNEDFGGLDVGTDDDPVALQFVETVLKHLNEISV